MVAASLAAQGFGGNIEGAQGSRRQGRGGRAVGRAAAGEQGRAVGPHEPGDVGAAHMMVKEPFHDPQQGIVQKRAPLHQHAVPKFGGRAQAQDFVQRVAGHGVAQPGGDVADVRAFLLRLFDLGIHEHGTARSQIHGMPGEQGGAHERLHAQVEAAGECFEEGPASGGAGFVEGHARALRHFISWPPMSMTYVASGTRRQAAFRCATVSTSADSEPRAACASCAP